jgi:siroheme synthase (precorrin-2 oxidase/ferrochelatase)
MNAAEREGNLLFPVFLKLEELNLLIVGGGFIGMEKLSAVLKNSPATRVVLVGIIVSDEIKQLATQYPHVTLVERASSKQIWTKRILSLPLTSDRSLNAL